MPDYSKEIMALQQTPLFKATRFSIERWKKTVDFGLEDAPQDLLRALENCGCLTELSLSVLLALPHVREGRLFEAGLPSIVHEVLEELLSQPQDLTLGQMADLTVHDDDFYAQFRLARVMLDLDKKQGNQNDANIITDILSTAVICEKIVAKGKCQTLPPALLAAFATAAEHYTMRLAQDSVVDWFVDDPQPLGSRLERAVRALKGQLPLPPAAPTPATPPDFHAAVSRRRGDTGAKFKL